MSHWRVSYRWWGSACFRGSMAIPWLDDSEFFFVFLAEKTQWRFNTFFYYYYCYIFFIYYLLVWMRECRVLFYFSYTLQLHYNNLGSLRWKLYGCLLYGCWDGRGFTNVEQSPPVSLKVCLLNPDYISLA